MTMVTHTFGRTDLRERGYAGSVPSKSVPECISAVAKSLAEDGMTILHLAIMFQLDGYVDALLSLNVGIYELREI